MNAAPNIPLVERVADAIEMAYRGAGNATLPDKHYLAQTALTACEAEAMRQNLRRLLAAIGGLPVIIMTEQMVDAVREAHTLLARLDGKP